MKSAINLLSPRASGIVYASAGSGKTWLLISRLLRLLLDKVCPSSILAITFTNKAADEMRDRVAERILEWNTQTPSQLEASLKEIGIVDVAKYMAPARCLYEQLLHSTEQMQITTFHAFCQKLISLCPLQSGAPLDFQIAENATEWQSKAIDILFSTTTLADKEMAEALDLLYAETQSINNVRTVLGAFLSRQNDWFNYVANIPSAADEASDRLYKQLDIAKTISVNEIWRNIRTAVVDYGDLLAQHPTTTNVAHAEVLKLLASLNELSDEDFAKLNHCIHTTAGEPRQRSLTKTLEKSLGETGAKKLIILCAEISSAVMQMRESNNRLANYNLNRAWYVAGSRLLDIYTELKQQHRLLDFNDLENIASKLLTQSDYGSHWIQYRLASRIEHILIDEFQDTNPTQWQLLQPLMEEIASQEGGSVFIVGDRKQSIYGFRRADPELQVKAGQWLSENLAGHETSADISYRSALPIIDFVNKIFYEHDILPDFQHHQTKRDVNGGIHIFDLFEPDADDKTKDTTQWRNPLRTPLLTTTDSHSEEATTVAQTIARLHQDKLMIEDSDRPRPIEYSDILIIARQKTHFDLFTQALRQQRIPVMSAYESGLLSRLEVRDMLQLLATLNNPYDDLALVQVLRSPIYALSDQHLLELSSEEGLHYFTKLKHAASKDKLWRGIYDDIKKWSALCARLPIHDLLYMIYDRQNLINRYRASLHPLERDQVQHHLEAFLEYVLDYDSGRYPDVNRFLDQVSTMQGEVEVPMPQAQNCVRMMSIHGAKGLEAAVVFVVDCAFRLPKRDTHDVLVDWPADSPSPRHFVLMPPTNKRSELLSELTATRHLRNQKEEMNLLYVALTRAKQYLFISASGKSKSDEHWYGLIKQSCAKQKIFGDDPLANIKNTTQRVTASATEPSVDLKLFNDAVAVNALQQQIEPSRVAASNIKTATAAAASKEAMLQGIIIHRALELLNRQSYADCGAFKQAFGAYYSSVNDEVIDACAEEAWQLVQNPKLKVLFDQTRYNESYYEMPLLYADDKGRVVYGKVDQVCVAQDCVRVIDYKTSRPPEHNRDSFYQTLAARYLPQMHCYKAGIAKLFPNKTINLSLLFTKSGFLYDYPSLDNSI